MKSVWETNGIILVSENTVFYVFSRPRSTAIIEPLKITDKETSWFVIFRSYRTESISRYIRINIAW